MKKGDSKGYYFILGVSPNANNEEIKKAYHLRAIEIHPDKNQYKNTTLEFQYLQEAYTVLKNPNLRAQYDCIDLKFEPGSNTPNQASSFEPIRCSKCNCISAQPRYVIFFEVMSFVVITRRIPLQGIFCPKCAFKVSIKASLITWILGWWGWPWGPFWSVGAIFTNLMGGKRLHDINARLLGVQAIYFFEKQNIELAKAITEVALIEARKFHSSPVFYDQSAFSKNEIARKKYLDEFDIFYENLKEFHNSFKMSSSKKLRNQWRILSKTFFTHTFILISIISFIGLILLRR